MMDGPGWSIEMKVMKFEEGSRSPAFRTSSKLVNFLPPPTWRSQVGLGCSCKNVGYVTQHVEKNLNVQESSNVNLLV